MSLKLTQNAKAAMLATNIPVSEGEDWTAEDQRNWADYLFFNHGVARHQVPFVFVYPESQAEPLRSLLLSDDAAALAPKAEAADTEGVEAEDTSDEEPQVQENTETESTETSEETETDESEGGESDDGAEDKPAEGDREFQV